MDWPGQATTSGLPQSTAATAAEGCPALPRHTKLQLEHQSLQHGRRNAQVSKGVGQVEEAPGRGGAPFSLVEQEAAGS